MLAPIAISGSASDLATGTVAAARLPLPSATSLGGVQSGTAPSSQFQTGISTSGVPTFAQPTFAGISGSLAFGQLPSIPSGTILANVSGSAGTPSALTPSVCSTGFASAWTGTAFACVSTSGSGGGSGAVAGSNTQVQFNASAAFGASADLAFNSASGTLAIDQPTITSGPALSLKQRANGNDTDVLQRVTDTSPTGYFLRGINAANGANIFSMDVLGAFIAASGQFSALAAAGPVAADSNGKLVQATATQITPLVSTFTSSASGAVPAPGTVSGRVLSDSGTWAAPSTGTPGGSTSHVQFNNAGAFAGDSGLVWDNTGKRLGIGVTPTAPLDTLGGVRHRGYPTQMWGADSGGNLTATRECTPIELFGGGTGVADNTAAYNAFWTYLGSTSGCLRFGSGTYTFATSPASKTLAAGQTVGIYGSAVHSSKLLFSSTSTSSTGLYFSYTSGNPATSVQMSNLTFVTAAATTGSAVYINGNNVAGQPAASNRYSNLHFMGDTTAHNWGYGLNFLDLANVYVNLVTWIGNVNDTNAGTYSGYPVNYIGSSSSTFPVSLFVDGVHATFANTCVSAGGYIQGIVVTNSECVAAKSGYYLSSNLGNQATVMFSETDTANSGIQINGTQGGGAIIGNWMISGSRPGATSGQANILLTGGVNDMTITGNSVGTNNNVGINCNAGGWNVISDNGFSNNASDIVIGSSCSYTAVGANTSNNAAHVASVSDSGTATLQVPVLKGGNVFKTPVTINETTATQALGVISNTNAAGGNVMVVDGGTYSNTADSSTVMMLYGTGNGSGVVGYVTRTAAGGVAYTNTSDRRLKAGIVDTKHGLDIVEKIPVRDYYMRDDKTKRTYQGFIAQEVLAAYPIAATAGGADPHKKPAGVDYGRMTPPLWRGVQQLKQISDRQDDEIRRLSKQIVAMEKKMQTMERRR